MLVAVNLLPADRRKKESTPLGVFLPLLAGVAVVAVTGFFWAWLHFTELARAEEERSELEATLTSKQPALKYVAALKEEQADFETRTATIREIAASRVSWTRKLDQFFDVAAEDADGSKYLIWLESLEVKPQLQNGPRKDAKGDQLLVKGHCLADGDVLQKFNVFHAAVKDSPFFKPDFLEINDPAGKTEELEGDLSPKTAWTVDLAMTMKAREPEKKAPPKSTPARVAQGR